MFLLMLKYAEQFQLQQADRGSEVRSGANIVQRNLRQSTGTSELISVHCYTEVHEPL